MKEAIHFFNAYGVREAVAKLTRSRMATSRDPTVIETYISKTVASHS